MCGIVPGIALTASPNIGGTGLILGSILGAGYALLFRSTTGTMLDHGVSAAALAVPAWALVQIAGAPLLRGSDPAWTAEAMGPLLPSLAIWVVAGLLLGGSVSLVSSAVERRYDHNRREDRFPDKKEQIVVLGGGFAGLTAAEELEDRFGPDPTVDITLVSKTNAILFTPMLAEVAAGSVEPTHITSPLRTSLRRTRVIQAEVTDIDVEDQHIRLDTDRRPSESPKEVRESRRSTSATHNELSYDHLVLAVGSVPDRKGIDERGDFAFDFKTLRDAIRLRNHVIDCFERAERTEDADLREVLVTFVIAGGGFAGAELAGALNDFVRGMLVHYPDIPREEVNVVVVHSRERIMPELSASLAEYALERMRERGVEFALETYVEDANDGVVSLSDGGEIRTETLVWTAGTRPNPLIKSLELPQTDAGTLIVDTDLSVSGRNGLWAAGDCAAVRDAATGERYPNTAEHAVRGAEVVAANIHVDVTGRERTEIEYQSPGSLAVIGYQSACAELWGIRFAGLFAWSLWRIVYLLKLPGTERKIRVLVDWIIEILFQRDIVQTLAFDTGGDHRGER